MKLSRCVYKDSCTRNMSLTEFGYSLRRKNKVKPDNSLFKCTETF